MNESKPPFSAASRSQSMVNGRPCGRAVEAHDLVAVLGDDDRVVLAEFDGVAGVGDERGNVGAEEHLVLTDADDQRRGATAGDDLPRLVDMGEQQGEGALETAEHGQCGRLEVASGGARGVGQGEQVGGDLGIGLTGELDARRLDLCAQRGEVLDDAVVDDRDLAVEGDVRVRVDVVRPTVGGPAGVPDAGRAGEPVAPVDLDLGEEVGELARLLLDLEPAGRHHRDPGRIVAPVLHPGEGVQTDVEGALTGLRVLQGIPDVSNDATHVDKDTEVRNPTVSPPSVKVGSWLRT